MYFSIDNVQKVFKRSRILGFAVGNGEEFPLPLQEYWFMSKDDHFIGQKTD